MRPGVLAFYWVPILYECNLVFEENDLIFHCLCASEILQTIQRGKDLNSSLVILLHKIMVLNYTKKYWQPFEYNTSLMLIFMIWPHDGFFVNKESIPHPLELREILRINDEQDERDEQN